MLKSKFMKKISLLVVLLAIAPLAVFAVTPDQPASTNSAKSTNLNTLFDSVVAKGKGVEVKKAELDSEVVNTEAVYNARHLPVPPDLEQDALRSLIIKQLILNKATPADRAKAKENFQNYLTAIRTNNGWSEEELNQRISTRLFGKTRAEWDQDNIDQQTIPQVLQRDMAITDDAAKKFYDDPKNISFLEQPEMVRASHILLMTIDPDTQQPLSEDKKAAKHKQMEDILKQARAAKGTNFADLAKKYSEDPGSKEKGGEYTFSRGKMVKEFEDTAFSLKPGEISEIIETKYGYHIIMLSEKIPAKKVSFSEAKDEIKNHLLQLAMQKDFRDYAIKLEKEANVQIVDEKYKGVDLAPPAPKPAETGMPPAAAGGTK